MNNTNYKKIFAILFLAGFPLALIFGFIFNDSIINWVQNLPLSGCVFFKQYHLNCPSCGNTRSVFSLLRGDIVSSLKYNITPFFFLVLTVAFYIEVLAYTIGKKIVIVPRKISFMVLTLIAFFVYFATRNFIPLLNNF